jgi:hypothetical protein
LQAILVRTDTMSMAKELKTMRIWRRFPKLAEMAIFPREKKETIDELYIRSSIYQARIGV